MAVPRGASRRGAPTIYYSICTDKAFAWRLTEFFDEKNTAPITLSVTPNEETS